MAELAGIIMCAGGFLKLTGYGNSAVFSRYEDGKASQVRDVPHFLKCILSVKEIR